jgi:hypothetical protein
MEQRLNTNDAAAKGAQIKLRREECASGMVRRRNYAAVVDAQIKLSKEECALGMEQKSNNAAVKAAQIMLYEEEYARDTVHTAIFTMNLQLSHRVLVQILIRLL